MNPVNVATKYVELGRQNGKTKALVMSLPDEKCAILTIANDNHDYIRTMIRDLRPDYNLDNVLFLEYSPGSGWRDKLLFRDMHVFLDNSVLDHNAIHLTKAINDVYGKTNTK